MDMTQCADKLPEPTPIKPPRKQIMPLIWVLASFVVPVFALCPIRQILHTFDLDTAALAPGTGIRPMGMAVQLLAMGGVSILIGDGCALVGGIISLKQRRWSLVALAVLAAICAWVPWFYSRWEVDQIVTLRKLWMEP